MRGAADEERRVAARAGLRGAELDDLLGCAEGDAGLDLVVPRPELGLGRGDVEHRRLPKPRVDAVRLAPRADSVHRRLGRAADRQGGGVAGAMAQRRDVPPERLAEAAVPAARAVSAHGRLEQENVEVGLELAQVPCRPHAEVAAAHHHDVCCCVAFEGPGRCDLARLLEPPAVARVAHHAVADGLRRASATLHAMTAATATHERPEERQPPDAQHRPTRRSKRDERRAEREPADRRCRRAKSSPAPTAASADSALSASTRELRRRCEPSPLMGREAYARSVRGGGRDSNPRPPGPQPGALPTELPPPRAGQDSAVHLPSRRRRGRPASASFARPGGRMRRGRRSRRRSSSCRRGEGASARAPFPRERRRGSSSSTRS